MTVIDHRRSFLKCLQDEVKWSTESGDESQVRFLESSNLCNARISKFEIFLADVRRRHRLQKNLVWHVHAFVVCAGYRVREVVAGQYSQQVSDEKHWIVRKAVGELFDTLRDFSIFEIAEAAIEVANLLSRGSHQDRKSTRLNSSHLVSSYAVFCWKKNIGQD